MLVRQLFNHSTFSYTYLVADSMNHEAVLIDPMKEKVVDYVQLFNELGLTAIAVIDTHSHDDHLSAIGVLAQHWGCDAIAGAPNDFPGLTRQVEDGDIIQIGDLQLKVIHTPGHTDDSHCYLIDRPGKSCVFTGDTLLVRSVGLSNQASSNPRKHYESLFNVLAKLPEDTLVYPGRDFKGWTQSTIGEEKHFNSYLLAGDIDVFLELKAEQKPAGIQPQSKLKNGADAKIEEGSSAPGTEDNDSGGFDTGNNDFFVPSEIRSPDAAAPLKHRASEDAVKNKEATEASEDKPEPLDDTVDVPSWR